MSNNITRVVVISYESRQDKEFLSLDSSPALRGDGGSWGCGSRQCFQHPLCVPAWAAIAVGVSACSSSCHLSQWFTPISHLFTSTNLHNKKTEDFQRNSKSGQTVFTSSWDSQSTLLQVGTSHNSGYEKAAHLQRFTNFYFKLCITKFPSLSSNSSGFLAREEQAAKSDRLMAHPA